MADGSLRVSGETASSAEQDPILAEFSGALIVLPPADLDGSFKSIELLVIDPARDAANFWFMTKTKVDAAVAQFDEAARLRERQGGMR